MKLEYVPLLEIQRDLYRLPRGSERFRAYLRTMVDPKTGDLELPLVAMNPMGKDHLPAFLEALLAMQADRAAAGATASAQADLRQESGDYRVGLVVSDDLKGGWTNRWTSEFSYRFEQKAYHTRRWIPTILWTSQTYTADEIDVEVRACIYRAAYAQRHGYASTLADMLAQESHAMGKAGGSPQLPAGELDRVRAVLAPLVDRKDRPTV